MTEGPIMFVDGHGLAFRAFYAIPELTAPDGTPTNALVGFFNMLSKIKKEWAPESLSVVFDAPGKTFRHEMFDEYKKGRKPTPEEFKIQLPILKKMLGLLGIPVICRPGVEADDVIGAVSREYAEKGTTVLVVTSDKDMLQILDEGITVIRPGKGISSFNRWDAETFQGEYGFSPARMADYLALVGDSVDNVPGVPGIGDKTARRLLGKYGDLEGILAHTADLTAGQRKKLEENADLARKSLMLTTLSVDGAPDDVDLVCGVPDPDGFVALCRELGMSSLERSMGDLICGEASFSGGSSVEKEAPSLPLVELKSVELDELLMCDELAFHGEWTGEYPLSLVADPLVVCAEDGRFWSGSEMPSELYSWLERGSVVTSDYKRLLVAMGVPLDHSRVWDLRSVDYLLHPDKASHDMPSVMVDDCPESTEERAMALWRLRDDLSQTIESRGLSEVLYDIDIPLVPVLVSMEKSGIKLEEPALQDVISDLKERLELIVEEITSAAGESINLNSPKQVGTLLFERLGLPPVKKTKTGYSTDVTVLEQLAELPKPHNAVPSMLLEHRALSKMSSGFALPLMSSVCEDGIIRSTFESDTTGTGRLSSRDPNLQNLPAYGEWSDRIKRSLIPREKGRCFVAADYSQVELRVLAHISGEKRLADVFRSGRDIHTETASMVFGVDPSMVTKELRRSAKMVTFGLLYGMSAFGLAKRLGVGRSEADRIMSRYFAALPGVEAYVTKSADVAIARGYTETLFGRIRPLEEVVTGNARDRGHVRRVAINSPIQGTAADLAKKAMIAVSRSFAEDSDVSMVLQVHDSIVCECPEERSEEVLAELQDIMKNVASLAVPLETEGKIGFSLAEV